MMLAIFPNKARQSLKEFALLIRRWQTVAATSPVSELLSIVLKESKYLDNLQEEARSQKMNLF